MPPMLTSVKGMMLALFAQWIGDDRPGAAVADLCPHHGQAVEDYLAANS